MPHKDEMIDYMKGLRSGENDPEYAFKQHKVFARKPGETSAEFRARRRKEKREAELSGEKLSWTCPICAIPKPNPRAWVFVSASTRLRLLALLRDDRAHVEKAVRAVLSAGAACRSCWWQLVVRRAKRLVTGTPTERFAAKRKALLDELVPDRRCPSCQRVYINSKSWVIRGRTAACKGCDMKNKENADGQ